MTATTEPRKYGVGEMRQKSPGVWALRVSLASDPITGKRRAKAETFRGNKTQAQARLRDMAADSTQRHTSAMTVGELLDEWWTIASPDFARSTRRSYKLALTRVPTSLRRAVAATVTAHDLERLYADVRAQVTTRSSNGEHSARTMHNVMAGAFGYGAKQRWIAHAPTTHAVAKLSRRPERTLPPDDVLARLCAVADDPMHRAFIHVALLTGARRSEMAALRWQDVNLDTGELRVHAQLEGDGSARKITKSVRGTRTVPMSATLVAELRRWRRRQQERSLEIGLAWRSSWYVLTPELDGSTWWTPNAMTYRFGVLRDTAGLDSDTRLHDLRHRCAVWMLVARVDPVTAAAILGHDIAVFLKLYANHLRSDASRDAVDAIERAAVAV